MESSCGNCDNVLFITLIQRQRSAGCPHPAPGRTPNRAMRTRYLNYSDFVIPRENSVSENVKTTIPPHSRESGNPDKLLILQVLLDSRFRGNEEVGENMLFSDRLFRGNYHAAAGGTTQHENTPPFIPPRRAGWRELGLFSEE